MLEFEIASVGDRLLAALIDLVIKFSYLILMLYVMIWSGLLGDYYHKYVFLIVIVLAAPYAFYDLLFELLWNGQSIGKRVFNIKVVKTDGSQPGLGEYFLRWLLRLVEIGIGSGLIAFISIVVSKKGQRLGDLAAGTTLIKLVKREKITDTILEQVEEEYEPTFPQVQKLSDRDANIIKQTLSKSRTNPETIRLLAEKIEEVLEIETELSPITFLNLVLKDFNYYTGTMRSRFDRPGKQPAA